MDVYEPPNVQKSVECGSISVRTESVHIAIGDNISESNFICSQFLDFT